MTLELKYFNKSEEEFLVDIFSFTWNISAIIYWMAKIDGNLLFINNGTCSFVRTPDGLFGVTAAHVIDEYEKDKKRFKDIRLIVRGPSAATIDIELVDKESDGYFDLSTFKVPVKFITESGLKILDHSKDDWPTSLPRKSDMLLLNGYPRQEVEDITDTLKFGMAHSTLYMSGVYADQIEMEIRKERLRYLPNHLPHDFRLAIGGCSGAPLLRFDKDAGQISLCGIFTEFVFSNNPEGGATAYAKRSSFINSDGTINRSMSPKLDM